MSVTAQLNKHGCSQMCSAMFVLIENPIGGPERLRGICIDKK